MRPTGGTAAQLFWTSTWAFSQEDSSVVPLHQHPGEYERVRFALPSRPLDFIRFDLSTGRATSSFAACASSIARAAPCASSIRW